MQVQGVGYEKLMRTKTKLKKYREAKIAESDKLARENTDLNLKITENNQKISNLKKKVEEKREELRVQYQDKFCCN